MDKATKMNVNIPWTEEFSKNYKPSPENFKTFVPWACGQLQCEKVVAVANVVQNEYVSIAPIKPGKSTHAQMPSNQKQKSEESISERSSNFDENAVKIIAVYSDDKLVQIKFSKNKHIPRIIFKIISLTVQFHKYLHTITINSGLDKYSIPELCRLLSQSNITDLCLDDAFIKEANYYLLLDHPTNLRHLSLARCNINDAVVKDMAAKLIYPLPAAQKLSILNLSSNRITNIGAKYLSEALRSNRQLSYLNLANNMLTDDGAIEILNSLQKFILTEDEMATTVERNGKCLKVKNELFTKMMKEAFDGKAIKPKKKITKPTTSFGKRGKVMEKETSRKSFLTGLETDAQKIQIFDQAQFKHPFDYSNTVVKNSLIYCNGNNTLCYLNLAYNNLSYFALKKLLSVLKFQEFMVRRPRGLINVCLEGNPLPVACYEMSKIDEILENAIAILDMRSIVKKRCSKPR